VRGLDVSIPLGVKAYYNTVHHAGHERFAQQLASAGVAGAIIPTSRSTSRVRGATLPTQRASRR
jgi:tryptophan synthase alpha subunit